MVVPSALPIKLICDETLVPLGNFLRTILVVDNVVKTQLLKTHLPKSMKKFDFNNNQTILQFDVY